jgi:hypothetical protein
MKLYFLFAVAGLVACGPEPTAASDESLAGTWRANAHLYTLSNIRLEIVQERNGIVSGKWFARGDGGLGGCFPQIPCDASGEIIGRNTVAQVEFDLISAGKFEGAHLEQDKLRGIFAVGASYDTITFIRNQVVTLGEKASK